MANIQERKNKDGSSQWRVRVRVKGKPLITKTFARKTDAKNWAQRIESNLRRGVVVPEQSRSKKTLVDLVDRYFVEELPRKRERTRVYQKHILTWWKQKIGDCLLKDLTPDKIDKARTQLEKQGNRKGGG